MLLEVLRYNDTGNETFGLLFIDGEFECYTLEDEERDVKVWGETRIPEGRYKIGLRNYGGHHVRYTKKFDFHKGMLQVLDVPNFTDILIHIGNRDEDTAGCLLVGQGVSGNAVTGSTLAYKSMYVKVAEAVEGGELVEIIYSEY